MGRALKHELHNDGDDDDDDDDDETGARGVWNIAQLHIMDYTSRTHVVVKRLH
jgi:hypothetical protein